MSNIKLMTQLGIKVVGCTTTGLSKYRGFLSEPVMQLHVAGFELVELREHRCHGVLATPGGDLMRLHPLAQLVTGEIHNFSCQ